MWYVIVTNHKYHILHIILLYIILHIIYFIGCDILYIIIMPNNQDVKLCKIVLDFNVLSTFRFTKLFSFFFLKSFWCSDNRYYFHLNMASYTVLYTILIGMLITKSNSVIGTKILKIEVIFALFIAVYIN